MRHFFILAFILGAPLVGAAQQNSHRIVAATREFFRAENPTPEIVTPELRFYTGAGSTWADPTRSERTLARLYYPDEESAQDHVNELLNGNKLLEAFRFARARNLNLVSIEGEHRSLARYMLVQYPVFRGWRHTLRQWFMDVAGKKVVRHHMGLFRNIGEDLAHILTLKADDIDQRAKDASEITLVEFQGNSFSQIAQYNLSIFEEPVRGPMVKMIFEQTSTLGGVPAQKTPDGGYIVALSPQNLHVVAAFVRTAAKKLTELIEYLPMTTSLFGLTTASL